MKTTLFLRKLFPRFGSVILLFLVLTAIGSSAQEVPSKTKPAFVISTSKTTNKLDTTPYLDRKAIGKLVFTRFSKISSGGTTGNNMVNSASVEALNGSWKLNGAIPIAKSGKDSSKISILNVRVGGDILAGNTITLFTDSKLNSGSFIDLQYNIGLKNTDKNIRYFDSDKFEYRQNLNKIYYDRNKEFNSREANDDILKRQNQVLDSTYQSKEILVQKAIEKRDSIRKLEKYSTQLQDIAKLSKEINQFKIDSLKINYQKDSISLMQSNLDSYNDDILTTAVNNKMDKAISKLNASAKVYSMYFIWFSASASIGHKSFYAYNWANPFASEVSKQSLNTYKIGTSVHYYVEFNKNFKNNPDELFNLYMNLGAQLYRDNNTDFLQPIDITEDHSYKNPTGDTVRKTSEKYKGYADSTLLTSTVFNAYFNAYLTLPHKFITLHFFPSVSSYYQGRVISNIGTGCIFSFKTEKKDQPIVNVELFIQANDIFRSKARDNYDYTTIGINLTHPINFIKN